MNYLNNQSLMLGIILLLLLAIFIFVIRIYQATKSPEIKKPKITRKRRVKQTCPYCNEEVDIPCIRPALCPNLDLTNNLEEKQ